MTNWLKETPLRPPAAEAPGAGFAPRRIDATVRSRRVPAPSTALYQSRRYVKIQRGIPVHSVPAKKVRDHIELLVSYGLNYSMIAAASGTSSSGVHKIATGPVRHVQRTTADAILRVTPSPHRLQRYVLAIGAIRRIRALQAIGWTVPAIAERANTNHVPIANLGQHPTITYARWKQIADIYDELSGTPGVNDRVRRWARKRSWATPFAWEGIDIDHPDSVPIADAEPAGQAVDEVLLQRIIDGRHIYPDANPLRGPERAAVIDHAISHNWLRARLAAALNISTDGADQALVRRRRELREAA